MITEFWNSVGKLARSIASPKFSNENGKGQKARRVSPSARTVLSGLKAPANMNSRGNRKNAASAVSAM